MTSTVENSKIDNTMDNDQNDDDGKNRKRNLGEIDNQTETTLMTARLKRNGIDSDEDQCKTKSQTKASSRIPTAKQYIAQPSEYTSLPPELQSIDFTQRITWRKYAPYQSTNSNSTLPPLPLVPPNTEPIFTAQSPALCHHVHAVSGRARACTVHLPSSRSVPTPIFMPVGTKGTIKSLTVQEIVEDKTGATDCPIVLANTYHLALQPGTDLVRDMGGLHKFMGWNRGILTDSGGFQMVSLLKLAEITEEGVTFENPFHEDDDRNDGDSTSNSNNNNQNKNDEKEASKDQKERMLLRPEDSIQHQNNIGSDIIMALDDVVSSTADDTERFTIATYRTLRWLDRCYAAHAKPESQNLFPIVQGGLDTELGGLREKCLAGFRFRDGYKDPAHHSNLEDDDNNNNNNNNSHDNAAGLLPGYAIGGLAGGESKDAFWRVVDQCCKALPDDKPRYLMGVGYPLDLVVCTALGVDMYDCVYPTRTARFGVALVPGVSPGTMRLKSNEYSNDDRVIMEGCGCQACAGLGDGMGGFSRARLHSMLKNGNPLAAALMTHHNIAYMMFLVRGMRKAIMEDRYGDYVRGFVRDQFPEMGDVPTWVKDALSAAGIELDS